MNGIQPYYPLPKAGAGGSNPMPATPTLEAQIKRATDCVLFGDFFQANTIYVSLRNQADQYKNNGNKEEHDQIYYRLFDLAIQFKHDDVFDNDSAATSHIFNVLSSSEQHQDPLNREASIRNCLHENPSFPIDPHGEYMEYLSTAATMPGRPWASYELGKMYEYGAIQTYCGKQKRDLLYEANLLSSQDESAIQKYENENFRVSPDSEVKAVDAYINAAKNGSVVAKQALELLSTTSNCPDALFHLSRMITYSEVYWMTNERAKTLSNRAATCFESIKERAYPSKTTNYDRTAHYPKNGDGTINKFHNNEHFKQGISLAPPPPTNV